MIFVSRIVGEHLGVFNWYSANRGWHCTNMCCWKCISLAIKFLIHLSVMGAVHLYSVHKRIVLMDDICTVDRRIDPCKRTWLRGWEFGIPLVFWKLLIFMTLYTLFGYGTPQSMYALPRMGSKLPLQHHSPTALDSCLLKIEARGVGEVGHTYFPISDILFWKTLI